MRPSDIPNILCVIRILTVAPITYFMLQQQHAAAFGIVFIGGLTDWIDGYLARRYQWGSRLGSILDPIADKIFIVSVFLLMAMEQMIPMWVALFVLARECIIVAGAIVYHLWIGRYDMAPTALGKFNTALQIVLILVTFSSAVWNIVPDSVLWGLIYLMLAATFISGASYVYTWGGKAWREHGRQKAHD